MSKEKEIQDHAPGAIPKTTKDFLKNHLEYWTGIEQTATNPLVQQKATNKVQAIALILNQQ